ncbi:MAG: peptide chain release factor N(5)-glutamine methyltransferase [Candidatus Omnitrophota bacterium]
MNEIETILCKLLACSRSELYLERSRKALSEKESRRLEAVLRRRMSGEPLQYLLGDADFMGLKLAVKPGVLIPRPETEVLVEETLACLKALFPAPLKILDLCTGSGNIAIALAAFLPARVCDEILATDISGTCLSVARGNARRCGVSDRIMFLESDLFLNLKGRAFDAIVSNPPYVSLRDYKRLPWDVRQEPAQALLAPENGLYFYKRIEKGSRDFLKPGGTLFLEIGDGQRQGLLKIFSRSSLWHEPRFIRDMAGRDRVAVIRRKS